MGRPGSDAADVEDQLRDALDVLDRLRRIHAALEAVAGVGRKLKRRPRPTASATRRQPRRRTFCVSSDTAVGRHP